MNEAQRAVEAALRWVGTPYHHQASRAEVGCDCLGLLRGVWRDVRGDEPCPVPAYTADWREPDGGEPLLEAARMYLHRAYGPTRGGDVLVFRMRERRAAKHCGIAISADRFVHAVERRGVVVEPLHAAWARRVAGRFRFAGSEQKE